MRPLLRRLANRLGGDVFLAEATDDALWPEEAACIAGAVTARQVEFAQGRAAAREALGALGHPPVAIPKDANRKPVWPKGIIGSITHTDDLCCAAVQLASSTAALGLDAERLDRSLSNDVLRHITTEAERAHLVKLSPIAIFSAKETIYKSFAPFLSEVWPFDAVTVQVNEAPQTFDVTLRRSAGPYAKGSMVHGVFERDGTHLLTAVSMA